MRHNAHFQHFGAWYKKKNRVITRKLGYASHKRPTSYPESYACPFPEYLLCQPISIHLCLDIELRILGSEQSGGDELGLAKVIASAERDESSVEKKKRALVCLLAAECQLLLDPPSSPFSLSTSSCLSGARRGKNRGK